MCRDRSLFAAVWGGVYDVVSACPGSKDRSLRGAGQSVPGDVSGTGVSEKCMGVCVTFLTE